MSLYHMDHSLPDFLAPQPGDYRTGSTSYVANHSHALSEEGRVTSLSPQRYGSSLFEPIIKHGLQLSESNCGDNLEGEPPPSGPPPSFFGSTALSRRRERAEAKKHKHKRHRFLRSRSGEQRLTQISDIRVEKELRGSRKSLIATGGKSLKWGSASGNAAASSASQKSIVPGGGFSKNLVGPSGLAHNLGKHEFYVHENKKNRIGNTTVSYGNIKSVESNWAKSSRTLASSRGSGGPSLDNRVLRGSGSRTRKSVQHTALMKTYSTTALKLNQKQVNNIDHQSLSGSRTASTNFVFKPSERRQSMLSSQQIQGPSHDSVKSLHRTLSMSNVAHPSPHDDENRIGGGHWEPTGGTSMSTMPNNNTQLSTRSNSQISSARRRLSTSVSRSGSKSRSRNSNRNTNRPNATRNSTDIATQSRLLQPTEASRSKNVRGSAGLTTTKRDRSTSRNRSRNNRSRSCSKGSSQLSETGDQYNHHNINKGPRVPSQLKSPRKSLAAHTQTVTFSPNLMFYNDRGVDSASDAPSRRSVEERNEQGTICRTGSTRFSNSNESCVVPKSILRSPGKQSPFEIKPPSLLDNTDTKKNNQSVSTKSTYPIYGNDLNVVGGIGSYSAKAAFRAALHPSLRASLPPSSNNNSASPRPYQRSDGVSEAKRDDHLTRLLKEDPSGTSLYLNKDEEDPSNLWSKSSNRAYARKYWEHKRAIQQERRVEKRLENTDFAPLGGYKSRSGAITVASTADNMYYNNSLALNCGVGWRALKDGYKYGRPGAFYPLDQNAYPEWRRKRSPPAYHGRNDLQPRWGRSSSPWKVGGAESWGISGLRKSPNNSDRGGSSRSPRHRASSPANIVRLPSPASAGGSTASMRSRSLSPGNSYRKSHMSMVNTSISPLSPGGPRIPSSPRLGARKRLSFSPPGRRHSTGISGIKSPRPVVRKLGGKTGPREVLG